MPVAFASVLVANAKTLGEWVATGVASVVWLALVVWAVRE